MRSYGSVYYGLAAILALGAKPGHADPMALWNIVTLKCVRHFEKSEAPIPCERLDFTGGEDRGYVYLKDINGVAQMLTIPIRRLSGIEDPVLLQPDAPNYFADAWGARPYVEAHLKQALPREAVAIAINSMYARSQSQFHLHVDCVDKDVAAALTSYSGPLDATFRPMTIDLKGRRYWARRLDSADLADASPFQLLADGIEGAKGEMGLWSLAAIGANFAGKKGFVLLADRFDTATGGHAEDLQDHHCLITAPKS